MLDFTAIDFETANSYRGSPCAVGVIRYRNGQPVDERRWLIRPPEQVDYFDPFNTALHGMDAETVKDAPRWSLVLPALVDHIGDDIVVAHNAGFDIGVIRYACAVDNIEWPGMQFLCTLVLARRAMRLPSYRLPFVTDACGFEMTDHHEPLADARAVGGIIASLAQESGVTDLRALAAAHHTCIGRMSSGNYKGSVSTLSGAGRPIRPDLNPDADPDGYLYGRVVVFTGSLMSMTRQIAWEECARGGAVPDQTPTKRTNILVVGDINPAVLRPGSNLTGKARRAFELQDKGQDIEVMTENDFLRCLDGKPLGNTIELMHDAAPQ
jgi:DNA polymerase III epsilon subunit-like protein